MFCFDNCPAKGFRNGLLETLQLKNQRFVCAVKQTLCGERFLCAASVESFHLSSFLGGPAIDRKTLRYELENARKREPRL
jgi:hypothetical protein